VEVSATYNAFNRESDYGQRDLVIKPSAAGATDVFTITAPLGYLIKGYSIGGHYYTVSETYTLISADGTQSAEVNTNSGTPNMLTVDNVNAPTTTFSMKSKGSSNNRFACIMQFTVTLSDATGIETMSDGRWTMGNAQIYNLAGQRLSKPQRGINIVNGKKVVVR